MVLSSLMSKRSSQVRSVRSRKAWRKDRNAAEKGEFMGVRRDLYGVERVGGEEEMRASRRAACSWGSGGEVGFVLLDGS